MNDMATLLNQIRDSPDIEVVRFKDRIKNPSGGWRDAMINFCVRKSDCPQHICEVQIVHQKMALCRRKDGLGGHDEYAQERNAREIIEHLGEKADKASLKGRLEDALQEASHHKADAEIGKAAVKWVSKTRRANAGKAKFTMTWIRQTRQNSEFITRMLFGLWRAKSRVRPTGSESQSVREVAEEALSVKKEPAAAKYHDTSSRVDCGTRGDARGGRR